MRVLFAGGGTSGHLAPCLAVAQALVDRRPDAVAEFVVSRNPRETEMVKSRGFEAFPISGSGMPYGCSLNAVRSLIHLAAGGFQALGLIRRRKPDVVFATGGFISAAVVPAAKIRGCPVMIHASDVMPDRTNRLLGRWADCVSIVDPAAAGVFEEAIVNGQPVRPELLDTDRTTARYTLDIPPEAFVLLVTGGSQGARRLNVATTGALTELLEIPDLHVIHLTGRGKMPDLDAMAESGLPMERYHVFEHRNDMGTALAAADLVLTRAGASSLAEASARGLPMIVVPYPHAGGHQHYNASAYGDSGAAIVVEDEWMTAARLVELVTDLKENPEQREQMARASEQMGSRDAADRIVDGLIRLAGENSENG